MTCKDCIHWKACRNTAYEYADEDAASAYDEDSCCKQFAEICENFSDKSEWLKSEWLHLLCKDYEKAYYVLGYGNDARVVEEPICGWAIKNEKCYIIDECGDLYEIGKEVFLTKENAEKDVERRKSLGGK